MLLGHARRQQTLLSHCISGVTLLRHALVRLHGGHTVFLSLFQEQSCSILFALISSDIAPIAQLILSRARLLGQHSGHPGGAHSEEPAETPRVVGSVLSQPEKPSAQSAVLADGSGCAKGVVTGVFGVLAGGRRKRRAGNSKGSVWLGCGDWKCFAMADAILTRC